MRRPLYWMISTLLLLILLDLDILYTHYTSKIANLLVEYMQTITTIVMALFTYFTYKLQQEINRPLVVAHLGRSEEKISVENLGKGVAFDGKIECYTTDYRVEYSFTRLIPNNREQYPSDGQPSLKLLLQTSQKMNIKITYYNKSKGESWYLLRKKYRWVDIQ